MKRRRAQHNAEALPAELPTAYGQTRLTLLDVDPFHVHAAWEVTPRDRAAAEKQFTAQSTAFFWILRFRDEQDGSSFDMPVNPDAGSWYVELLAADKTYHAELGPIAVTGAFVAVCRSNTLATPPAAPAQPQEPQWLEVAGTLGEAKRVAAPEREASPLPKTAAQGPVAQGQLAAPTGAQVEPMLAEPLGRPQQAFPLALPPLNEICTPVTPLGTLDIPTEVAAALTEKPAAADTPVAPVQPVTETTSAVAAPAVATERSTSSEAVSSFSWGGGVAQAAITLELNAEVIVYGRAQPGQTLCVNGRPVSVNDDGTFHVRWALPVAKP